VGDEPALGIPPLVCDFSVLMSLFGATGVAAIFVGPLHGGFTLQTYTHLVPSSHDRARAAIDGVLGATTWQGPTRTPIAAAGSRQLPP
jgi:hypothetical protein